MELIVITVEEIFPEEEKFWMLLFEEGLHRLHIRKPLATCFELEELLRKIPSLYYPRMVLHDHFDLALLYGLGGVHLNRRNPLPPKGFTGKISASCHSLQELTPKNGTFDYLFLSPVFDSISKQGYGSAFPAEILQEASAQGTINQKVIALGGITPERITFLHQLGFGGIAVLGTIWKKRTVKAVSAAFASVKEALLLTEKRAE